ncbi:spherulin-1B precursor [Aspergillus flavus]|nr:spherulin-1B precursor [Aspergillus flavus]
MVSTSALRSVAAVMIALAIPASAAPQPVSKRSTSELSLTAQLRLADTAIERYQLLPKDEDFVFNFTASEVPVATSQNFPALVGTGASFSIGELPACSMSFLHLHPRATELFALTSGRVLSEMVPEAGVLDSEGKQRVIRVELGPGMVTIYPAGSFHTQVNPDCEPANFAATFNSDEFAVGLVAAETFSLTDDVIAATFGQSIAGEDIETVRNAIPTTMAIKVEECLRKCDADHSFNETTRDQKRRGFVNASIFTTKLYLRIPRPNKFGYFIGFGSQVLRKTRESAPCEKFHHPFIKGYIEEIEYCGKEIHDKGGYIDQEIPAWDKWTGPAGWSKERWGFWKERFEWISTVTALDRQTRKIATKPVEQMTSIERGEDGIIYAD